MLGTESPAGQALCTPLMVGLARAIYNPRPGELAGTLRDPAELCTLPWLTGRRSNLCYSTRSSLPLTGIIPLAAGRRRTRRNGSCSSPATLREIVSDLAWWELPIAGAPGFVIFAAGIVFGVAVGVAAGAVAVAVAGTGLAAGAWAWAWAGVAAGVAFGAAGVAGGWAALALGEGLAAAGLARVAAQVTPGVLGSSAPAVPRSVLARGHGRGLWGRFRPAGSRRMRVVAGVAVGVAAGVAAGVGVTLAVGGVAAGITAVSGDGSGSWSGIIHSFAAPLQRGNFMK